MLARTSHFLKSPELFLVSSRMPFRISIMNLEVRTGEIVTFSVESALGTIYDTYSPILVSSLKTEIAPLNVCQTKKSSAEPKIRGTG